MGYDKKKIKFIMTFISSILFYIGEVYCLQIGQFNVYFTSYFYHMNPNQEIEMQYGNLLIPLFLFCYSIFQPFGGYFLKKLGVKLTLIITSLFTELFLFLFINQTNIWFSFLIIILLGIIEGIGTAAPGRNVYYYYPEKNGIISSCIDSSTLIMSMLIGSLGEKMINPNGVMLRPEERYFPMEISKNCILYYRYALIVIPISLILTLLLMSEPYGKKKKKENKIQVFICGNIQGKKGRKFINDDLKYSENLKSAIFSKRLWRIAGIFTLSSFIIGFSDNTFRVYGSLTQINSNIMQYLQVFTCFSSIIIGPIWRLINDKFEFSKIIKILCIFPIIHSCILGIFIKFNFIYVICIIFGSIFLSGIVVVIRPHIMDVFGIKYLLEIRGIVNISGSISDIFGAGISFFISNYYHTGKELQVSYRVVYLLGVVICFFAFYLSTNENNNKFDYDYPIDSELLESLKKY